VKFPGNYLTKSTIPFLFQWRCLSSKIFEQSNHPIPKPWSRSSGVWTGTGHKGVMLAMKCLRVLNQTLMSSLPGIPQSFILSPLNSGNKSDKQSMSSFNLMIV